MRIYCAKDYAGLSRRAANIIAAHAVVNPACVLGLATGSTPIGAYQELGRLYAQGDVNFSRVRTVNLDEYVGLGPEHPQSYRHFMRKNLFEQINIPLANTYLPDGLAPDAEAVCSRYDRLIRELGGIDLQLLGIGHNGHIGFNEPDEAFALETHRVRLAQSTIEANARFFAAEDEVPRAAYTMGIKTIMQARAILVVVSGADKADIACRAFVGSVTPQVPASILQMHPNVTLCGDAAALSKLMEAGAEVCG